MFCEKLVSVDYQKSVHNVYTKVTYLELNRDEKCYADFIEVYFEDYVLVSTDDEDDMLQI